VKTCKKCKETKALELFSKDARGKDGYAPRCKVCVYEYDKALREKLREQDPEAYKAKVKAKNEKYKDKISANAKAYRARHRTEIQKRKQERIKQRLAIDAEFRIKYIARRKAQYERRKDVMCDRAKQKRAELSDTYIKSLMGYAHDVYVAPDLIEARRQQVISRREKINLNLDPNKLTRYCSKCKCEKPKTEYYKHGNKIQSHCKTCTKEAYMNYINKHPEKVKQYRTEYYKNNKEKIIEATKRFYESHPGYAAAYVKRWRAENPELARESDRKYRAKNADKVRAWSRKYRQAQSDNLTDRYIIDRFNYGGEGAKVKLNNIPQSLIEAKRLQLLIWRKLNEKCNTTT
jgi:hypothetical protein